MRSIDICAKAKAIAASKNIYVRGGNGQKLTQANKLRFTGTDVFNNKRASIIFSADEDTVAYDEYGLLSAISGYNCRNLGEVMNLCEDVSKDFSTIIPGEIVFMKDRIGVFVGNGQVVTCSNVGVGYTIVDGWVSHGKLPDVEYVVKEETKDAEREVERDVQSEEPSEVSTEEPAKQETPEVETRRDTFRRRH